MHVSGTGGSQAAAMAQMRERMFNRADSDSSGGLSLDEFSRMARRGPAESSGAAASPAARRAGSSLQDVFTTMDRNGDGQVTAAEMAASLPPGQTNGPLGSGTLSTLLAGQSQEAGQNGGIQQTHRRHRHAEGTEARRAQPDDSAMQRMLDAYRARQAQAGGSGGITA